MVGGEIPSTGAEPSLDKFTVWPLASCIVILHILYFIFQEMLDDSLGSAILAGFIGLPLLGFGWVVWLFHIVDELRSKNWRRCASSLFGPIIGALAVWLMLQAGCPPWRLWFEFSRPYYLVRVWAAPASDGRKLLVFPQVDKELWQGHEKREFIYADDPSKWPTMGGPVCAMTNAGGEWTTMTNLGLGFYAKTVDTSYTVGCAQQPR